MDNVTLQRVRNPVRVLRAEAVEHGRVVEHDNVRRDRLTCIAEAFFRVRILARAQRGNEQGQPEKAITQLGQNVRLAADVVEQFKCSHETILPLRETLRPGWMRERPPVCTGTSMRAVGTFLIENNKVAVVTRYCEIVWKT